MPKTIWINQNNDIPDDAEDKIADYCANDVQATKEWLNDWYESLDLPGFGNVHIKGTVNSGCPWSVWKGYGGWFCKETEEKCIFSTPCFFKCDIYQKG